MMNVLDLFSGIGGFSLGLERTGGFQTVAFCEIDPYCQRILAKHWPDVPIFGDVRTITAEVMGNTNRAQRHRSLDGVSEKRGEVASPAGTIYTGDSSIDVICGGFPCQDISVAGKGAGLAGSRSGLWKEYARIIGELRPRYVIVENVAALLSRGLGDVLGDLATLGYDAEWHCIPASAVGAPHRRDRIWIVAYAMRDGSQRAESSTQSGWRRRLANPDSAPEPLADTNNQRLEECWLYDERRQEISDAAGCSGRDSSTVADSASSRRSQPIWPSSPLRGRKTLELAGLLGEPRTEWLTEPDVGRVAHGVPARVDRLKALGNAVVPQIPEIIGLAILAAEEIHIGK